MRRKPEPPDALAPIVPGSVTVFDSRPDLKEEADRYTDRALAKNTSAARASDWKVFACWCAENGASPLPASPADVAAFLTDQARDKATATVLRRAQTITAAHEQSGFPSPSKSAEVKRILAGIRNEKGVRPEKKAAITREIVERALPAPTSIRGIRDRAVLLFGLSTALRRSNICAVDIEDLTWVDQGIVVEVRRSKTDQIGEGARVAIPYVEMGACPARAVRAWIDAAAVTSGPLFRGLRKGGIVLPNRLGDREVARIVKRAAKAAGLRAEDFGGHSLRAGYVTEARLRGIDWPTIMEQTGHKLLDTAKRYSRYTPEVFEATRVAEVFGGVIKGDPDWLVGAKPGKGH